MYRTSTFLITAFIASLFQPVLARDDREDRLIKIIALQSSLLDELKREIDHLTYIYEGAKSDPIESPLFSKISQAEEDVAFIFDDMAESALKLELSEIKEKFKALNQKATKLETSLSSSINELESLYKALASESQETAENYENTSPLCFDYYRLDIPRTSKSLKKADLEPYEEIITQYPNFQLETEVTCTMRPDLCVPDFDWWD